MQCGFRELLQRICKDGDIQNMILTPDKELKILMYWTTSCVVIYKSYTLLNRVQFFGPTCIISQFGELHDSQTADATCSIFDSPSESFHILFSHLERNARRKISKILWVTFSQKLVNSGPHMAESTWSISTYCQGHYQHLPTDVTERESTKLCYMFGNGSDLKMHL